MIKITKSDESATKLDLAILKADLLERIGALEHNLDSKNISYHDEMLKRMDSILVELVTLREDSTMSTYQMTELRRKIDIYEKRLNKVEKMSKN